MDAEPGAMLKVGYQGQGRPSKGISIIEARCCKHQRRKKSGSRGCPMFRKGIFKRFAGSKKRFSNLQGKEDDTHG